MSVVGVKFSNHVGWKAKPISYLTLAWFEPGHYAQPCRMKSFAPADQNPSWLLAPERDEFILETAATGLQGRIRL